MGPAWHLDDAWSEGVRAVRYDVAGEVFTGRAVQYVQIPCGSVCNETAAAYKVATCLDLRVSHDPGNDISKFSSFSSVQNLSPFFLFF